MKDVTYFPLYAANIMASRNYKLMSLGERGLWISITLECWVNGGVPADFKQMAKILGFPEQEIVHFFSNYQTTFFDIDGDQYISKELEEYRQGYLATREKKRLGGIKGAKEKKARQKSAQIEAQGIPEGHPVGSLIQFKSASIKSNPINSNQLVSMKLTDKEFEAWMDGSHDAPDIAEEYLRQSRG